MKNEEYATVRNQFPSAVICISLTVANIQWAPAIWQYSIRSGVTLDSNEALCAGEKIRVCVEVVNTHTHTHTRKTPPTPTSQPKKERPHSSLWHHSSASTVCLPLRDKWPPGTVALWRARGGLRQTHLSAQFLFRGNGTSLRAHKEMDKKNLFHLLTGCSVMRR